MPREIRNWEAALDALEAIGNGRKPREPTLEEIAARIARAAPRGLRLRVFPWREYGLERVYIHAYDRRGTLLTNRLFWQAGGLCWKYPPQPRPEWFYRLRESLQNLV